jgi:outer membrane protein assembly factor BamE (lipoprotein component of BamABCDE complex)
MKKKILTLLATLALAAGCAGTGFKWDQARKVKEGMTEKELTAVMGSPYQVRVDATGQQLWQWVYVDLYGVAGGTRTLNITMKDGVVLKTPVIPEAFK